jgi:hypothetical protein
MTGGFNFSPSCHFDWVLAPQQHVGLGHWLGFDLSGCLSGERNSTYQGPGGPVSASLLHVSQSSGALFSLESFVFADILPSIGHQLTVTSSKGGVFTTSGIEGLFTERQFVADEWKDVAWLVFDAGGAGLPVGIDNLVLSSSALPEPGVLGLSIAALLGAGVASRRRPLSSITPKVD